MFIEWTVWCRKLIFKIGTPVNKVVPKKTRLSWIANFSDFNHERNFLEDYTNTILISRYICNELAKPIQNVYNYFG